MNPIDRPDTVDDLLRQAGAQWRAEQPPAPEPDLDRITTGTNSSGNGPRRWVPALAAASVAAIAAVTLTVLPDTGRQPVQQSAPQLGPASLPPAGPTPQAVESVAQGNQPVGSNDDLLVRNGDKVHLSGEIIAAPNTAPIFCASHPIPMIGYLPGSAPKPTCPAGLQVTLKGVDVGRLTALTTVDGVRQGRAALTGIWNDKTIDVQQQSAPEPDLDLVTPPLQCLPPQGGWKVKPANLEAPAVTKFLDSHRGQAFGPVTYSVDGPGTAKAVVAFLGVAHGDRAAFRKAFEQVYTGNLCVGPARLSQSDADRLSKDVGGLMNRADLGITTSYTQMDGASENVRLLIYTDAVKAALAPIGLGDLRVEPEIRPVH
jgi:hypothetical protein